MTETLHSMAEVMLGGALFFVLISWTYDLWKAGWL
jgi:hypothetical protein